MTASMRELRHLTDDQVAELWHVGSIDLDTVIAEGNRRDDAERRAREAKDRARARASAERAAWLDAAHAQYLAADAECAGHRVRDGVSVADALSLWRGSEAWARGQASEELNNYWDVHGRLSLAEYRRQQAMQRRAARDERDLAAMPAPAPERTAPAPRPREVRREMPAPRPAWPAPTMRPASARELAEQAARQPRPPGSIARYITALGLLERQANATARALARVNGGIAA